MLSHELQIESGKSQRSDQLPAEYQALLEALHEEQGKKLKSAGEVTDRHGQLTLRVISSSDQKTAEFLWKHLESKLGELSLACSWDWTKTWLEHYGDLVPHQFVLAINNNELKGICLLTEGVGRKNGPLPVRTIHLGTAGEPHSDSVYTEHNELCVESRWQNEFIQKLSDLINDRDDWHEFHLDGFSNDVADLFIQEGVEWQIDKRVCHIHDLQSARENESNAQSQLGSSTRKVLRKNLKAYSSLQTEWAENLDQAHSIYEDLVRLHQERWNSVNKPGVYASKRFYNFHKSIIDRLFDLGKVALFRVYNGSSLVGCNQLFIDRNRALCYQGGSAPYEGKWSPGLLTDYLCIEECLKRGFDEYDFLDGESHHKKRLSTKSAPLTWAVLNRPRRLTSVIETLRKVKKVVSPQK